MAKSKRVYQVAKEIGVNSKAIVEKCQAEGVPGIENHMSTVKLGLIETIREWFAQSEAHNAVEQAEKVDLSKARKGVRKAKAKAAGAATDDGGGTATAVDEADASESVADAEPEAKQAKATKATKATKARKAAKRKADDPVADDQAEEAAESAPAETAVAAEAPSETATPADTSEADTPAAPTEVAAEAESVEEAATEKPASAEDVGPAGVPNVPSRPDVVLPAGEKLDKPKSVTLRGPKVIRVEKPDQLPRPRSRPGPQQQGDRMVADGSVPGITRSRGPARGRGAGAAPGKDAEAERRKRRSANTRRGGRSGDALLTGPAQLSEADLAELDAKLKGAGGFVKRRRHSAKKGGGGPVAPTPAQTGGKVEIEEPITIKSLSSATGIKSVDIIKHLLKQGIMATVNSAIETEAAMEVSMEYEIELEVKEQQTAAELIEQEFDEQEAVDIAPRPPIVTVLGHVDHGKTSLLDRIRKADVADHEDGGITQHVGAYRVTIKGHDEQDKTVVFLDTPGHEAFTSMRARGAQMTDIIVLVIAADDGVMPQTIESINHAKSAGVPVVVALNKSDRPEATEENVQKIYGQLAEHGLNPTAWGGETEVVKTSAITGDGVTDLLETLDLQAELLELTADYGGAARGTVIEAEMQEGRGPVARVLVQNGQLKIGDFICIGRSFGRVRDMTNDRGARVLEVGPATPIELSGIDMVPDAGDKLYATTTLKKADDVATHFRETERSRELRGKNKVSLEGWVDRHEASQMKDLRVVIKADVQGSIETLVKSLNEIGNDEVTVRVIHSAVGGINESDVLLADASDAIVIGFHVVAPAAVRDIAEQRGVEVRLFRVIYDVIDTIKAGLEGMLAPEINEEDIGSAEVKEVFKIGKVGAVAGCIVTEGSVQKSAKAKVIRDSVVVTDNRSIESLRRVKEDASEVRAGTECGIRLAGFEDLKPGDSIVCYNVTEVKRKLD